MQSLLKDCKTSRKKNKGVTSVWLLSEKSMAVTMVAVSIRVVKRYAKKCRDTCNSMFDFSDSNHKLVTLLFFLLDVLQSSSKLYIASLFPASSKQS